MVGGEFLAILVLGVLLGIQIEKYKGARGARSRVEPQTHSIFDWFTPEPTAPTVDVPRMTNTMPRVRPSWRKERRNIEAAHNSKQKERDALVR